MTASQPRLKGTGLRQHISHLIVIGTALFTLTACSVYQQWNDEQASTLAREKVRKETRSCLDVLRSTAGVHVWQQGEAMHVLLSSAMLFESGQAVLTDKGRGALAHAACIIKGYTYPVFTTVSGHSNGVVSSALTNLRAHSAGAYLWGKGIARERIKILNAGSAHPISSTQTLSGRSDNHRLEIDIIPLSLLPSP